MKYWTHYWHRLWELAREPRREPASPEIDIGREQAPSEAEHTSGTSRSSLREQVDRFRRRNRGSSHERQGRPLPPATRERLEASLGADFSSLRIAEDEAATEAMNARALALDDQILVHKAADAGDFDLLAHEAAHIAQAQNRGEQDGVSKPGGATEAEAKQASQTARAGDQAHLQSSGGPVPAIQRQEQSPGTAPPSNPVVRRESVRFMLIMQYQQQGGQGAFALSPRVQSELRRLIPETSGADLARIWTPEPANAEIAFQRLLDAGYLSLFTPSEQPDPEITPTPVQPAPAPEPEAAVTPFSMGMAGLHFRLNPRTPTPISASIRQNFASRGLPVSQREIDALLAGRRQGVEQINNILRHILSGVNEADRISLAETIADVLLDRSVQGQLELVAPTPVERFERQTDFIQSMQGDLPGLLERVPVGASITIYF